MAMRSFKFLISFSLVWISFLSYLGPVASFRIFSRFWWKTAKLACSSFYFSSDCISCESIWNSCGTTTGFRNLAN